MRELFSFIPKSEIKMIPDLFVELISVRINLANFLNDSIPYPRKKVLACGYRINAMDAEYIPSRSDS
jgi:hypothetical protein